LVILPILNEVDNIIPLLDGIRRELTDLPHVVCFIDDGSTDGTLDKVRAAMTRSANIYLLQGKKISRGCRRGGALKAGLEWGLANTPCTVFVEMDGDMSHRAEELPTGIKLIDEGYCDVAIASKYVRGSRVTNRPLTRRLVSQIASLAVSTLITPRIRDYSNGYRFYSRAAAELLLQHRIKYDTPIYLSETLAIWLKCGMRVIEFPSVYIGRNEGLSKLRWSDLTQASLVSFEIAWRYHVTGFAPRVGAEPASPLADAGTEAKDSLAPLIPPASRPVEEHGSAAGEGIP
jgi:dolichol-phosphate mannosyltransferase